MPCTTSEKLPQLVCPIRQGLLCSLLVCVRMAPEGDSQGELCVPHAFHGLPWYKQGCLPHRDAEGAGVAHLVHLHQGSCGEWQPRQRPDAVITNPPWGNRLMGAEADDSSALEATWTELGLFLKVSTSLH